jgi:hypothetical protein
MIRRAFPVKPFDLLRAGICLLVLLLAFALWQGPSCS